MKNILFSTSFLFIILQANSQDIQYGIKDNFNYKPFKGLKEYYLYVDSAEFKITEQKWDEAASYYEKAFQYKKHPFIMDRTRAYLSLQKSKKVDKSLLNYLISYSAKYPGEKDYNYLKTIEYNKTKFPKIDSTFFNSLAIELDTIKPFFYKNPELIETIKKMHNEDQLVRTSKPIDYEKMREVDSLNLCKLMDLYNIYGNINELNTSKETLLNINLILFHNKNISVWYPIVQVQVMNGSYPNKLFVDLLSDYYRDVNSNANAFGFYQGKGLFDKYIVILLDKREEIEINKHRKKFLLEPYKDQEKKKIWYMFNKKLDPYNQLIFYPAEIIYPPIEFLTEKEINEFKNLQKKDIEKYKEQYKDMLLIFDVNSTKYDINIK